MKGFVILIGFFLTIRAFALFEFLPSYIPSQQTSSDTSQVLLFNQQAIDYLTSEPTKAKQLGEEALILSRKLKFSRGEMMALNVLSDYHFRQSNYARGIEYATQVLKIATQKGDSVSMADAYRGLGIINTLGLKQYDQALIYQQKALKIYESIGDKFKIAGSYGNVTWIYAMTNRNLEEASRMADKGVAISRELKNERLLSYNYNSKGLIFLRMDKLDSALFTLNKSIAAGELANDRAVIAYDESIIGDIYLKKKNFDAAIIHFSKSVEEGEKLNLREIIKDAYGGLSKAYEVKRQFEKAFYYQLRYTQLKDSLLNWETTQKTLMIQRGYDEERKGAQIIQLERENKLAQEEKRVYIISFSLGFMLLIIVIVVITRSNAQRRATNLLLQEKNDEIKTQNEELLQSREEISAQRDIVGEQNTKLQEVNNTKDKLFSIIGHDLRGPIATLRSLLGLVERDVVSPDELKMLTPKINQNVGKLQEMLENLLQWSRAQMTGFSIKPSLNDIYSLIEDKLSIFKDSAAGKGINLKNEVPKEITVFADENHLKLILRNLISNAIKFTPEGGLITISAHSDGDFNVIEVSDSGVGISFERIEKLFEPNTHYTSHGTQGEKGTGLGLILCREMAEANGGRITVSSTPGVGSTFSVFLKAHA